MGSGLPPTPRQRRRSSSNSSNSSNSNSSNSISTLPSATLINLVGRRQPMRSTPIMIILIIQLPNLHLESREDQTTNTTAASTRPARTLSRPPTKPNLRILLELVTLVRLRTLALLAAHLQYNHPIVSQRAQRLAKLLARLKATLQIRLLTRSEAQVNGINTPRRSTSLSPFTVTSSTSVTIAILRKLSRRRRICHTPPSLKRRR
ncbi:hypothetical protein CRV24_002502 [Beauveria bassiana]|nr:hypothetical protein CRV24_002502 [Beauveria bassiana]KAH8717868.1 hypothetical protein HC256_002544 [Beauveria bassiana]